MSSVISLIAAIGNNLELGANNELLWHLPDDFKWFVQRTKGHPVIMGRKTMESLGKPLKNRRNIVITRQDNLAFEGFDIVNSMDRALEIAAQSEGSDEIFIIGGGEIYKQSIENADRLYITKVLADFPEATAFFPVIPDHWNVIYYEHRDMDENHKYPFDFMILEKEKSTI